MFNLFNAKPKLNTLEGTDDSTYDYGLAVFT